MNDQCYYIKPGEHISIGLTVWYVKQEPRGEYSRVVALCYSEADARLVRDALEAYAETQNRPQAKPAMGA